MFLQNPRQKCFKEEWIRVLNVVKRSGEMITKKLPIRIRYPSKNQPHRATIKLQDIVTIVSDVHIQWRKEIVPKAYLAKIQSEGSFLNGDFFNIIMLLCGFQSFLRCMLSHTTHTYNKLQNSHIYDLFITGDKTMAQKG